MAELSEVRCGHCGEPVPRGLNLQLEIGGKLQPMCCSGCLAVAQFITGSGLDRYYQFRQELAPTVDPDWQRSADAWQEIDPRQALWGRVQADGSYLLLLQLEGVRCAACAWLIRRRLESLSGISSVQVDMATGFTQVRWRPDQTRLSRIAATLYSLGYVPHLPIASAEEAGRRRERTESLKRLGVAGLGMMQVMMYAVGLYAGDYYGMEPAARGFLGWVSLLVTLPVLLYSGRVFFSNAWHSIRAGRPGMDVPVSLAIGIAFLFSCVHFFQGEGEIWFDSVVMFIFFLTLGRHVELVLRQRNVQVSTALARLLPEWARRVDPAGMIETVPASDLVPGDRVRVSAGQAFPADGRLLAGSLEVDESLLTGESRPVPKTAGESVVAGSINRSDSADIEVTVPPDESTVSSLGRMLLGGRASRRDNEDLPSWLVPAFVVSVALLALAGWSYWQLHEPTLAMPVALAVLVASCPCALSLAMPAVRAAASLGLLRQGVLVTRGAAILEILRVDTVLFDKTGTLTRGRPERQHIHLNAQRAGSGKATNAEEAVALAAALEAHSSHPLALAFHDVGAGGQEAEGVRLVPGCGLEGMIAGQRYRLGTRQFAEVPDGISSGDPGDSGLWLADEHGWICQFEVADELRRGAIEVVTALQQSGLDVEILSGDAAQAVEPCARRLGIDAWQARCTPQQKMQRIRQLQQQGRRVLMVGDGVNDAPVLAAADVSIAVSGASEVANSAADLIFTGQSLAGLLETLRLARKARRLIRQNLTWALCYNAAVMPLALSAQLQPWMAALGMSTSSLLVVLNAARLNRARLNGAQPASAARPVSA